MDFMPRDANILRWINGHGFVTIRQAATWLDISYQNTHRRLKRLSEANYLAPKRIGHSRYVYLVTKVGVMACGDDLPPLKAIRFGSFYHDLQLVDLATELAEKPGGHFITERRLRQERGITAIGIHGHVADGLLKREGQKPIAIELELSTKGWRRLQGIMSGYAADFDIGEVWYFAGSEPLRRRLQRAAEGYAFINIHHWPTEIAIS